MNRNRIVNSAVLIALLVIILAAGYAYFRRGDDDSESEYVTVEVSRGTIRRTVSSTGTLQAVITVQVGSQVSGRINELYADFNSVVKKNQILAVIDPANFEAQRQRAMASLATSKAAVKNAEANLVSREAELISAKANLVASGVTEKEAERQLHRSQGLFADRLISEQDLERAQANFDQATARRQQAEAQVSQSEASIRSAHAQLDQARANVKQAQADLTIAEVNLRYTKIVSPIEGVVVERNVDIGQTVAASFQAPVLFLIANDLAKMQVIAQIDEADIGTISERAGVRFTVDAFPGDNFRGKISEIRLSSNLPGSSTSGSTAGTGGGATNVVVYNVIIDVENRQLKLRPGMTATVTFTVASVEDTLKVANAALRYRPADKSPQEIAELLGASRRMVLAKGDGDSLSKRPSSSGAPSQGSPRWFRDQGHQGKGDGEKSRKERAASSKAVSRSPLIVQPSTIEQYGIKTGPKIHFPPIEEAGTRRGLLWVLDESGQPQPRKVQLGITDGRETAVLSGDLEEGELVITWKVDQEAEIRTQSPFGGAFGSRRRRQTSGGRGGAAGAGRGRGRTQQRGR